MEFACAWAHLSIFEIRVWCVARAQALPCCLLPYFTPPSSSSPSSTCRHPTNPKRLATWLEGARLQREVDSKEAGRRGSGGERARLGLLQTLVSQTERMCFQFVSRLHVFFVRAGQQLPSFLSKQQNSITSTVNVLFSTLFFLSLLLFHFDKNLIWHNICFYGNSFTHNNMIIDLQLGILLQVSWGRGTYFVSWFHVVSC